MTSNLMGIGSKQDNASKNSQVYLLFAREVGPLIKAKYPSVEKLQFNQILGRIWNELPAVEKNKYYMKAEHQKQMEVVPPGVRGPHMPELGVLVEPLKTQMVPGPGSGDLRKLKPILKFPSSADKDKYPTFQSYYKDIRYHLKLKYPIIDEQELVKKGFEMFKEMHKPETGFEEFSLETKQNLIKKYPNLTLKEIAQLVEKIWEKMSSSEREKYCGKSGATGGPAGTGGTGGATTERTENILMREDDNTKASPEPQAEYFQPTEEISKEETVNLKVEEQPVPSVGGGDGGEDHTDPLFINCHSETTEDTPPVPAATERLEEEALDDPDDVVGPEEEEQGGGDGLEEGEVVPPPVPPVPPVFCYCRTTVTDNLVKCEACQEFYHQECLRLTPEDLQEPDWRCPECRALQGVQAPPGPPGPLIIPAVKNKVAPVKHPRFIKYQKVVERGEGGKCTTCKILVEEVKKRSEIIDQLRKRIELLESEAAGEDEATSRQL